MTSERDGVVVGSARSLFDSGTAIGLDDAQLIDRFLASRDEAAFAMLVARHGPMVLAICRGVSRDEHDAQDAFQATFVVLARRAGSIRQRASLASWLYGVARKIAVRARADAQRRRRQERQVAEQATVSINPDPAREDHAALYEEIDRLPGTYREPIILCYLDGMTYEDAARHLACPLGTLSIRLKRARDRLRSSLTRRGMAVPSGVLAIGLAPTSAPAAVPVGLARLAVRSGLLAVGGKALAVGTVPASVALMARRMTMLMRLQTVAVGLLVVGGVVVATAGSLALKAAAVVHTPPPSPRVEPAIEPRSWVVTFPNGTTIELIGISTHPSNPGSWRQPDGTPLLNPPYHHANYRIKTSQDRQIYEVAYRVRDQPGQPGNVLLETVPPSSSPSGSAGLDPKGVPIPGISSQCFDFAGDLASCSLRFGLATGPWTTAGSNPGRDITGLSRKDGIDIVFGTAIEVGARTHITVSRSETPDDDRLVAVDLKGEERAPIGGQSVGVTRFGQMEMVYNLPLAEISEFRYQTRPYGWATIENLILQPGR